MWRNIIIIIIIIIINIYSIWQGSKIYFQISNMIIFLNKIPVTIMKYLNQNTINLWVKCIPPRHPPSTK